MNRREFSLVSATVMALGAAGMAGGESLAKKRATPSAQELYRRALVLDCNLGPELGDSLPLSPEALASVKSSGVTVMKTTMGGFGDDFDSTVAEIAFFMQAIEAHPDVFMQITRPRGFRGREADQEAWNHIFVRGCRHA